MDKEYIIFCDESDKLGRYYSNFYGGLIVGASQYERVTKRLNTTKFDLNLFGEIKWEKVTQRYLEKYKSVMESFFKEVAGKNVKVRIMFRQNAQRPRGLSQTQVEVQYYLLYYQFIKHAFGLTFLDPRPEGTQLRLYFDKLPDTGEKVEQFKGFLGALQRWRGFQDANIRIADENITEVKSHDHVLLQCLDIVLGSIAFRLNDRHKQKIPGKRLRGKRTRAKEDLYRFIHDQICQIYPRFNIGVSTSIRGEVKNRWVDPYRHWCFQPKEFDYAEDLTKGRQG